MVPDQMCHSRIIIDCLLSVLINYFLSRLAILVLHVLIILPL
jgi:hypothetical protein